MAKKTAPSWSDIKKRRERATQTVPVCLNQRVLSEIDELNQQLINARMEDRRHEGELDWAPKSKEIAERILELEAQAAADEVEFVVGEVPRAEWNVLLRKNAPTKEQRKDGVTRFNPETFVPAALAASAVSPALTSEEAEELCADWPEGLVSRIFNAVLEVNMGERTRPKAGTSMASEVIREYEGNLRQPSDSESPLASSQDG